MRRPKKQYVVLLRIEPNDRGDLEYIASAWSTYGTLQPEHKAMYFILDCEGRSWRSMLTHAQVFVKKVEQDLVSGIKSITMKVEER